jgi:hypothetical protein
MSSEEAVTVEETTSVQKVVSDDGQKFINTFEVLYHIFFC